MLPVVAPETPGPMPVPDINGVRVPVDVHLRENGPVIDVTGDGDRLVDIRFAIGEDLRIFLPIRSNHGVPDGTMRGIQSRIIQHHGIYGEFLDPRQSWRDIALEQRNVDTTVR